MIQLVNASRSFKTRSRTVGALQNASLTLPDKGMFFLLGPSGAGKSTLLNIISLQDRLTEGKLFIDGIDTSTLKEKDLSALRNSYFGIVFQERNLIESFSVYENLALGKRLQGEDMTKEEAIEALKEVGLGSEILDESPKNLSGGQAQRVSFARAAIKGSKAYVCDEPTGSLDYDNAKGVMEVLKRLSEHSLVIVATHDRALAAEYAECTMTIDNGHLSIPEYLASKKDEKISPSPLPASKTLSWRHRLFFATHSFKGLVGRTIFSFLMVLCALTSALASFSYMFYDRDAAIATAIEDYNATTMRIGYNIQVSPNVYTLQKMSETDHNEVKELLGGSLDRLSLSSSYDFMASLNFKENTGLEEDSQDFPLLDNFTSINQETADLFSMRVVGTYPQGTEDQVMLTSYECYLLGWVGEENLHNRSALQQIVDSKKEFYMEAYTGEVDETTGEPIFERMPFSVVGIVDTYYDLLDESIRLESYVRLKRDELRYTSCLDVFVSEELLNVLCTWMTYGEKLSYEHLTPLYPTKNGGFFKESQINAIFAKNNTEEVEHVAGIHTILDYSIQSADDLRNSQTQMFLAAFALFGVLFVLSLLSFTQASVEKSLPTVRTLRSLGITKGGVYGIFSIQSSMISLSSIIFAFIIYLIYFFYSRSRALAQYCYVIHFQMNAWAVLLALAVTLLISIGFSVLFASLAMKKKKLN